MRCVRKWHLVLPLPDHLHNSFWRWCGTSETVEMPCWTDSIFDLPKCEVRESWRAVAGIEAQRVSVFCSWWALFEVSKLLILDCTMLCIVPLKICVHGSPQRFCGSRLGSWHEMKPMPCPELLQRDHHVARTSLMILFNSITLDSYYYKFCVKLIWLCV